MPSPATEPPAPWRQVNYPPRGNRPARVEILFAPDYLCALWDHRLNPAKSPAVTRGISISPDGETLMLDTVIPINGSSAFVRAWLVPAVEREYFHLRVEITAPEPIKRNLRVTLNWDNGDYTSVMRAGNLFFEDITPPNISKHFGNLPSRRFRLTFEFEAPTKNSKH